VAGVSHRVMVVNVIMPYVDVKTVYNIPRQVSTFLVSFVFVCRPSVDRTRTAPKA
jgi:hypothetical protein